MRHVLAAFRWRDVLDIVLLAVLIYRVLVVFRGTRAAQMLAGLGLLIACTLLAQRLELASLSWFFENLWSFWLVALLVLFQPEFRRALGRVGEGAVVRTLVGASRQERAQVVREVANAVDVLAPDRTGALIVIERGTGLHPYAELGVPLDALVSSELLVSLFPAASPLHDGAVLLRGDRLVAAGCFLPLSRNRELARALGTRHRAALGVSEETDAIAVVVSEESGRISVAVEGRIDTVADGDALRRVLTDFLVGPAAPEASGALARGMARLRRRTADRA